MSNLVFVGNPNAGKSTWINFLSNASMKVANYAGVSVEEQSVSMIYQNKKLELIDLPGIYDLEVVNGEECYAKQYLHHHTIDLLVNIIDVRDLKRGLHLTAQLKRLKIPMVVVLNFIDENVNREEMKKLSKLIKTPILYSGLQNREQILETFFEVMASPAYEEFDEKALYFLKVEGVEKNYTLDRWLLHPIFGIPFLFLLLATSIVLLYYISTPFSDAIVFLCTTVADHLLFPIFHQITLPMVVSIFDSLWFAFVSVFSFLPFLFAVFFLLAALEESGYIARIAYLLDGFMKLFRLSGKSVIPLLIGFSCNVAAILSCRTIPNEKERKVTALMVPFVSCSAKLPVFLLFLHVFFPKAQVIALLLLYGVSVLVSLFIGACMAKHHEEEVFVLELPSYAIPRFSLLFHKATQECHHFIRKVSKVMFLSALILAFLMPILNHDIFLSLFSPLGFAESEIAVQSLPFGLLSKENLLVYYAQRSGDQALQQWIATLWQNPHATLKALCYLLYLAMSVPCIMTLSALKSEYGWKLLMLSLAIMLITPYLLSLLAYQLMLFFSMIG